MDGVHTATAIAIIVISNANSQPISSSAKMNRPVLDIEYHFEIIRNEVAELAKRRKAARWSRLRQLLWQDTNGVCPYCGRHTPEEHRTIEHLIPRAHGGSNHWRNLMAACSSCNHSKPNSMSPALYCRDLSWFFYVLIREQDAYVNISLTVRQKVG